MKEKAHVLIVDDDPGMRETLADILGNMGYGVDTAGDGYEAIEMIRKRTYGVALMDIRMPGINGVGTLKEVKRTSPSTRVIMMTAYSGEQDVQEALNEGACCVFYKPLDIDRVVSYIEKVQKGALILLVDDDPAFCETLLDVLQEKGCRVCVAHGGEEAIEKVQSKAYDIAFIDVKMPGQNGLETYRAIRKVNPEVSVVMVTGYRQEAKKLVEDAITESAYTCLYKPLDMDQVAAIVEKLLSQKPCGTPDKPGKEGNLYA